MMKLISRIIAVFVLLAILSPALPAQQNRPGTPLDFKATVIDPANDGSKAIQLSWVINNNGTTPTRFDIYMAYGQTDSKDKFKKIDYVKYSADAREYKYTVAHLQTGVYSFFIKAVREDSGTLTESEPTKVLFVELNVSKDPYIHISSTPNPYGSIDKLWDYQVKAETNVDCQLTYSIFEGPDGMTIEKNTGHVTWTPTQNGSYGVVITVSLANCDKQLSVYQKFVIKVGEVDQHSLRITSEPVTQAEIGKEYIYEIKAVSDYNCPIMFKWKIYQANNLVLTGDGNIIKWVPEKAGEYMVSVYAYMQCDEKVSASQQFMIKIPGEDVKTCAKITGAVVNEKGEKIKEGRVSAWLVMSNTDYAKPYFYGTITDGQFSLKVAEGVYKIRFEGASFYAEWYEDAKEMKDAKSIGIKCGEVFTLQAAVQSVPEPNMFTVKGRVTSESTGKGVFALVEFIPLASNFDKNTSPDQRKVYQTKTNEDGYYEIKLPDVLTYTAHAVSLMNSVYYLPQYYDRVDNPWEADIIVVEEDIDGIDFVLKSGLNNQNGFTGQVRDEQGNALQARVLAYLVGEPNSNSHAYKYMQESRTDENGYFRFANLVQGDYVLLSIPIDYRFVPGYYHDNGLVTQKWREATKISVGDNMIEMVFNCTHRMKKSLTGYTKIKGQVSGEGDIMKSAGDVINGLVPISGAFVYVTDATGDIIGYSFTDATGYFDISELQDGQYILNVDRVGYEYYSKPVATDYEKNQSLDMNLSINMASASSVPDDLSGGSLAIYPSPASSYAVFSSDQLAGSVDLSILNSLGEVVLSAKVPASNGIISTNLEKLSGGMYYARIISGGRIFTGSFCIIR